MGVRDVGPVDQEEVAHVELRGPVAGDVKLGLPGAGPSPTTVKLRTGDQAESSREDGAADELRRLTRQKYVPFGRPLILSRVLVGIVADRRTHS